jgi:uncharacterized protein YprB with RNaseH-like and TPR domain
MLSDEIRARLGRLHRSHPTGPHDRALAPGVAESNALALPSAPAATLADPLEHGEVCENASGKHLRFCRPLARLDAPADRAIVRQAATPTARSCRPLHQELAEVADHFPRNTLFLDLETCGFAGSMVFLAGLVRHAQGKLVLDQLFARNYAEERALLETLWQIAGQNRVLVTFNGKSFDWPMIHDRSTRHHLGKDLRGRKQSARRAAPLSDGLGKHDARPELAHCDLLHHARRRWKGLLPNCKLQTLEGFVCNRWRRDDLPGAQVPAAYHEFVRSGQPGAVGAILHHNALDLLTLAQITVRLAFA